MFRGTHSLSPRRATMVSDTVCLPPCRPFQKTPAPTNIELIDCDASFLSGSRCAARRQFDFVMLALMVDIGEPISGCSTYCAAAQIMMPRRASEIGHEIRYSSLPLRPTAEARYRASSVKSPSGATRHGQCQPSFLILFHRSRQRTKFSTAPPFCRALTRQIRSYYRRLI
jgi:hypothetical protein